MRYLAVMAAGEKRSEIGLPEDQERLPIVIYMRDWAKHPERSLLDQVQDYIENTLQVELPPGFLEHWTDGQALLLLDGLDEVAADATRAALVEKINCFLSAPAHEENWAVITSRPWGYSRAYFQTDTYPHFELEPFNDKQVQEFIEYWYLNRCDNNAAEAQKMVQDLQDALNRKDRLQNLVKNPLLLTMVALIHRYQDTLPKRRHKLYDRAVDTLLKSWDRKGKGETYGQFNHLDRDDDLRRVMSQLAHWIHTQYETQSTESGTLIEEEDLFTQLSRIIREEYPQVKPHQAREEAERFVTFIRDRTGLLNEYGQGRYAFVHKTFQEYLTAEAILNKSEYEDDSELIYNDIRTHLHNPHWREVILLLISQLQGKKAAKAIEVILLQNSPYEKWLHRDLLFAGRCLTEDPEKLSTAEPNIASEILKRLFELEKRDKTRVGESIKHATLEVLSCMKETDFEVEALSNLKAAKEQLDLWIFLNLRWKLGEKDIAITYLLKLLKDGDSSSSFQSGVATALKNLGGASQEIIQSLLNLLKDENPSVRSNATSALGNVGSESHEVIRTLLRLIEDKNPSVRSSTASALGNLGQGSNKVIQTLLILIEDKDPSVRSSAATALGSLGSASQEVVHILLNLIKDKNFFVRSSAASALGNLGNASQEVIQTLLNLLEGENPSVRSNAASALGNLGNSSPEVVQGLLGLIEEENLYVRSSAASALVSLESASQEVVHILLNLLKDNDSSVRYSAASSLGKLGKSHLEFQSTLIQWIEQHSDLPTLGSAIDALWQICA